MWEDGLLILSPRGDSSLEIIFPPRCVPGWKLSHLWGSIESLTLPLVHRAKEAQKAAKSMVTYEKGAARFGKDGEMDDRDIGMTHDE